ncbi:TPA: UbiD family decarboxylase, partial [Candidatus Bathyarchaeota archaeon]|nr:UbiD family decarboxylase [Candidatus Bathyarchaeota archaeon]
RALNKLREFVEFTGEVENVSIHRLLVLDEKHLAIRLVPRHLYRLWRMAKEEGKDLDVGIAIGVHPAIMLAAASSPPFGVSEYRIANELLDKKLRLVQCKSVDAYVPSEAELVLEGRISHKKEVLEGPLADITGTYDVQRMQPVVEIVNISHRENYIYQALLPGGPEHRLLMGLPREVAIYEAVSRVVPNIKAVNLSEGGCGWLHAIISIEKQTEGDAKNAILAAFVAHGSLKHVIVVDADIDVYDLKSVEWALATRFQADEDLIMIRNIHGSTLDPSANQESGLTTKLGIDATKPLSKPQEGFHRAHIPLTPKAKRIIKLLKRKGTI